MSEINNKSEMRRSFLEARDELAPEVRETQDKQIAENLLAFLSEREVSSLLIYVSFRSEVDTLGIIERALAEGMRVAAPRCSSEAGVMHFYEIEKTTDLESGKFGILEPAKILCDEFTGDESSICVVPGAAFDRKGYRIGYGAGYYDRYLENFSGKTVGLAYDCQLSDIPLPHEKFDKALDFLITSERCYII